MANKKVVPGSLTDAYKKREGDFSPDLVGFQLTKGTPLFTLGNFGVTTNLEAREETYYNNGEYSKTYTLETLQLTEQQSKSLVSNNIYTTLNVDTTDLSKFVYYGSMYEFMRVNIEGIITKWKGSLFITEDEGGFSNVAKNTVLGYNYDPLSDISTMTIPTLFIQNNFELITNDLGGFILDETDISNIKLSYSSYEISNEFGNFELLGYTGDTENVNPYINLTLKGEVFPTLTATTFGTFNYHLKPKDNVVDRLFFDSLTDFENVLLNRLVTPKYTSVYETVVETESGEILSIKKSYTWPTTDGFNIDIDTVEYSQYLDGILKLSSDFDRLKGNLMSRRFVSNSIKEFDTDNDSSGVDSQSRKVNKLLTIYGREFDEVKKYVDSVKFANVVTYDKKNNTPDELIKNMARTLGFDAIQSVSNNNLMDYIHKSNEVIFSGQSRSLSTKEIDVELWRRLVINAWWLFKSKGHRKVLEFLIKLFGLNDCLVNLDEHVYLAKDKLDVEEVFKTLGELDKFDGGSGVVDRSLYPIDEEGFPKTLPNTPEYYFQMKGFWYNNGSENTVGNNPHFGPYDYGSTYFDKFRCFVDDFSGKTQTKTQEYLENVNLFPDYNKGDLEITFEDGKPLVDYGVEYADLMSENNRVSTNIGVTSAGFTNKNSRTGDGSLQISFNVCDDGYCDLECPTYFKDDTTGVVYFENGSDRDSLSKECCELSGFYYDSWEVPQIYFENSPPEIQKTNEDYKEIMTKSYGESELNENPNFCFHCRPTFPVCDMNSYVESIIKEKGNEGFIDILIKEGFISEGNRSDFLKVLASEKGESAKQEVTAALSDRYDGNCLIVHSGFDDVSQSCCETRGGTWKSFEGRGGNRCVVVVEDEPTKCSEMNAEFFSIEVSSREAKITFSGTPAEYLEYYYREDNGTPVIGRGYITQRTTTLSNLNPSTEYFFQVQDRRGKCPYPIEFTTQSDGNNECSLTNEIVSLEQNGNVLSVVVDPNYDGSLTYLWSDGSTTQTTKGVSGGEQYEVTITDVSSPNCSVTKQYLVPRDEIKIGDCYEGGYVFYLYEEGGGLVISKEDIKNYVSPNGTLCANTKIKPSDPQQVPDPTFNLSSDRDYITDEFYPQYNEFRKAYNYGVGSGRENTDAWLRLYRDYDTPFAAKLTDEYVNPDDGSGEYSDWYLPSEGELETARINLSSTDPTNPNVLRDVYGFNRDNNCSSLKAYITSSYGTQTDGEKANMYNSMSDCTVGGDLGQCPFKTNRFDDSTAKVRPIRRF